VVSTKAESPEPSFLASAPTVNNCSQEQSALTPDQQWITERRYEGPEEAPQKVNAERPLNSEVAGAPDRPIGGALGRRAGIRDVRLRPQRARHGPTCHLAPSSTYVRGTAHGRSQR
jgi:hypothetical protein